MFSDNIHRITINNPEYPTLLKHIADPPSQLYVRGNIDVLSSPHMLAVVGSRKANTYGAKTCNTLLPPVIEAGVVIVSGLAYGIDSLAHRSSVASASPTIAVLAGGIDDETIYPQAHRSLVDEILYHGGAIISEHPPKTACLPAYFLHRNRIITGLAQTTLVIQAAVRSGSLVTARLALEYNREVLAVPGQIDDPISEGTNLLIQDGAGVALSPQDILDTFAFEPAEEAQTSLTML